MAAEPSSEVQWHLSGKKLGKLIQRHQRGSKKPVSLRIPFGAEVVKVELTSSQVYEDEVLARWKKNSPRSFSFSECFRDRPWRLCAFNVDT